MMSNAYTYFSDTHAFPRSISAMILKVIWLIGAWLIGAWLIRH
jgi:hypothetical protein